MNNNKNLRDLYDASYLDTLTMYERYSLKGSGYVEIATKLEQVDESGIMFNGFFVPITDVRIVNVNMPDMSMKTVYFITDEYYWEYINKDCAHNVVLKSTKAVISGPHANKQEANKAMYAMREHYLYEVAKIIPHH